MTATFRRAFPVLLSFLAITVSEEGWPMQPVDFSPTELEAFLSKPHPGLREQWIQAGFARHPLMEKTIAQLVSELESPRYSDRQVATHRLYHLGELALPYLETQRNHPALETRVRVAGLLADPVFTTSLTSLIQGISSALEALPELNELRSTRQLVQNAFRSIPAPLRKSLTVDLGKAVGQLSLAQSGMTPAALVDKARTELALAKNAVLENIYAELLATGTPVLLEQEFLLIRLPERSYRLRISDWSFLLLPATEEASVFQLRSLFPTPDRISNGRRARSRTDNRRWVEPDMEFSVLPHAAWRINPDETLLLCDIRHHVRGPGFGTTTTGDSLQVADYLVSEFFEYESWVVSDAIEKIRIKRAKERLQPH